MHTKEAVVINHKLLGKMVLMGSNPAKIAQWLKAHIDTTSTTVIVKEQTKCLSP